MATHVTSLLRRVARFPARAHICRFATSAIACLQRARWSFLKLPSLNLCCDLAYSDLESLRSYPPQHCGIRRARTNLSLRPLSVLLASK